MSYKVIIVLHKSITAHQAFPDYTPLAFGMTLCPAKYNSGQTNLPANYNPSVYINSTTV